MTDSEKKRIRAMRSDGKSYAEIAAALNIQTGTIKIYCQRSNLGGIRSAVGRAAHGKVSSCEQCGQAVKQQNGRKHKRFCCDACRLAWWSEHRSEVKQNTTHTFTCAYCGKEFSLYGVTARKYCTHECYVRSRFSANGKESAAL